MRKKNKSQLQIAAAILCFTLLISGISVHAEGQSSSTPAPPLGSSESAPALPDETAPSEPSEPDDTILGESDSYADTDPETQVEPDESPILGESQEEPILMSASFSTPVKEGYQPTMDKLEPDVYIPFRTYDVDMHMYDMYGQNLAGYRWPYKKIPNYEPSSNFDRLYNRSPGPYLSFWVDHLESFKLEPRNVASDFLVLPEDPRGNIDQPEEYKEAVRITEVLYYPNFDSYYPETIWIESAEERYYLPVSRETQVPEEEQYIYPLVMSEIMDALVPEDKRHTGDVGVFRIATQQFNLSRGGSNNREMYIYLGWEDIQATIEIKGATGPQNIDPQEILLHSTNTISNTDSLQHNWTLSGATLPSELTGENQKQLNDALPTLEAGSYTITYLVTGTSNLQEELRGFDTKDFILTKPMVNELENAAVGNYIVGNQEAWSPTDNATLEYWEVEESAAKTQIPEIVMNSFTQYNKQFSYDTIYQLRPVDVSPGYKFSHLEIAYDGELLESVTPTDGIVEFQFPSSPEANAVTISAYFEKASLDTSLEALLLPLDANHITGQTFPIVIQQTGSTVPLFDKAVPPSNVGDTPPEVVSRLLLNGEYTITIAENSEYTLDSVTFVDPATKIPLADSLQPEKQGSTNTFVFTVQEEHKDMLLQIKLITELTGELSLQFVTPTVDFGSLTVGEAGHLLNSESFTYTVMDSRVTPGNWTLSLQASPFSWKEDPSVTLPYTGLSFSEDGESFEPVAPSTPMIVEKGSTNTNNSDNNKELHTKTWKADSGEGFSFISPNRPALAGDYNSTITWTLTTAP